MNKTIYATYIAPEGDSKVAEVGSLTFFSGQPLEIECTEANAGLIKMLSKNQHFKVSDNSKPPDEAAEEATQAEGEAEDDSDDSAPAHRRRRR
jgi:hypothetical protein